MRALGMVWDSFFTCHKYNWCVILFIASFLQNDTIGIDLQNLYYS
jgi:hypothetical protein